MKRLLKKWYLLSLATIIIISAFPIEGFAFNSDVNAKLKGSICLFIGSPIAYFDNMETQIDAQNINVSPLVKNGRTLIPVRFIAEKFGLIINISGSTIEIGDSKNLIQMTIGSRIMNVGGKEITLDVPPQIINNRTFIPLRAMVEALNKKLFWDNRGLIIISDTENILDAALDQIQIDQVINKFEARGNSVGNISGYGNVCQYGDWIYYSEDSTGLYKSRLDGSNTQKICDEYAEYINVLGDWIYCTLVNYQDGTYSGLGMYKIKTDGSEKIKLTDGRSEYINVIGDWIYYIEDARGIPYKMEIDGTGKKKIANVYMMCLTVYHDWIYFQNAGDNNKLYKMKLDGSSIQNISVDFAYRLKINIQDNWIYCIDDYPNTGLYKLKTDGTNRQKLYEEVISGLNVIDDTIYFIVFGDGIYKMNLDGSKVIKLYDGKDDYYISGIYLAGEWIYYDLYQSGLYKMKLDGTDNQLVLSATN